MHGFACWALVSIGWANADALESVWARAQSALASPSSMVLPQLSSREWGRVAEGEVVAKGWEAEGRPDGVTGVFLLSLPLESLWMAVLDDVHNDLASGLRERQLSAPDAGMKELYQRLELPAPFADRHWVLHIQSVEITGTPGERRWQRRWDIDPAGEERVLDLPSSWQPGEEEVIWTPVNDGAWLFLELEEAVLIVYQARTEVEGWIPNRLVSAFTRGGLEDMRDRLSRAALEAPGHYDAHHLPIRDAGGRPLESGLGVAP